MKRVSEPKLNGDTNLQEADIKLDERENDALLSAVVSFLSTHKDDSSDNIYQRLKSIRLVLLELSNTFKPT